MNNINDTYLAKLLSLCEEYIRNTPIITPQERIKFDSMNNLIIIQLLIDILHHLEEFHNDFNKKP